MGTYFEGRVGCESDGRVGSLSHCLPSSISTILKPRELETNDREETTIDPSDTFLAHDGNGTMQETSVTRYFALLIVNQFRPILLISSVSHSVPRRETHLMVSLGVTANRASIIPAPNPATNPSSAPILTLSLSTRLTQQTLRSRQLALRNSTISPTSIGREARDVHPDQRASS